MTATVEFKLNLIVHPAFSFFDWQSGFPKKSVDYFDCGFLIGSILFHSKSNYPDFMSLWMNRRDFNDFSMPDTSA